MAHDVPPRHRVAAVNHVVIAGGGLAGAAVAFALARAGERVTVIERNSGPSHKICGEFLSAEAQHYLTRLGLNPRALGGHIITQLRLIRGGRVVQCELPFRGLGLSRFVLDEALLHQAEAAGAEIRRGETVSQVSPEIRFLATGKHDIRPARRTLAAPPEDLVGFKLHLRLIPAQTAQLSGAVEVILFRGGYAGLQRIEDGRANLCLLVHRDRLAQSGGTWTTLCADLSRESPHVGARLEGAEPLFERPLSIARVPFGFIHQPEPGEAIFRIGDQACVIPSFSGDGMSMALHSAALAVRCYLSGESPTLYHHLLRADVAAPINRAMTLYRFGRGRVGQMALMQGLALWPGLMRRAALATRIAEPAWITDAVA